MGNLSTGRRAPECTDSLPKDRRLELLSDERRRHVVAHLREAAAPVAVADLARRVAERESEQSSTAAPDHQSAVHRSLHHCHVPKLSEADVVAHDRDRDTVEPAANFRCVVELWDSLSGVEDDG